MREVYDTVNNPPTLGERFTSPLGIVEYCQRGNFEDGHPCNYCAFYESSICKKVDCSGIAEGTFRRG